MLDDSVASVVVHELPHTICGDGYFWLGGFTLRDGESCRSLVNHRRGDDALVGLRGSTVKEQGLQPCSLNVRDFHGAIQR